MDIPWIDEFVSRLSVVTPVLCIQGPTGSGKSTLLRLIIHRYREIKEDPNITVTDASPGKPLAPEQISESDILVLDDFDWLALDEATAGRIRSALVHGERPRVVLIASQQAPPAYAGGSVVDELLAMATVYTMSGQRIQLSELTLFPELTLYVDPGSAPPEAIGELLSEISQLYRMIGGSGITFTQAGVRSPEVVA